MKNTPSFGNYHLENEQYENKRHIGTSIRPADSGAGRKKHTTGEGNTEARP